MGGYHESFAITRKGHDAIVKIDEQFCVYTSMQAAAHNLVILAKANPGAEFTIRQFRMRLPWTQ